MTSRSAPWIFSPTGVRMPVVSMSMRPLIGWVQALDSPGICRASFISVTRSSLEMRSGVICRKTERRNPGAQEEYQVLLRPPLRLRLEGDDRLEHGQGSGVGRGLGPAGLAEDALHLGEFADDAVGHLKGLAGLVDGDPGHGRGHVEEGAFVERRHELRAELEVDGDGQDDDQDRRGDDRLRPAERPSRRRLVDPDQEAADRVLFLGPDGADQDGVRRPRQPAGPEAEGLEVGHGHPQRRIEGDGQEGGHDDRQRLGVGQGPEEAALLGLEGQHGEERRGDDEQGEEARAADLLDGPDDDPPVVLLAAVPVPLLDLLVGLLDDDDRGVDEGADGDGDARRGT